MKKLLLAVVALLLPALAGAQVYDANGREKVNVETGAVTCSQATAANLKVDLSGTGANSTAVKTDGSASTQPVSGTVTCNAGTNLNTSALATSAKQDTIIGHVDGIEGALATITAAISSSKVQVDVISMPTTTVTDGSGALNVIVDSSALPSGAATSAKQPALGTAGSAASDVITVQGVASMTPLLVGDGTGSLNVIVDSSALPSGAATAANQDGVIKDGTGDTTQANVASGRLAVDPGTVTITDGAGAVNVIVDSASLGTVTVSGSVTASDPSFTDATASTVPANAAFVAGTDGTNTRALKTDTGGELQIDVLSSALPSGAATSANQDGIIRDGTGDTTQANVASGRLSVDPGTVTVTDGAGALNTIVDSGTLTAVTSITNAVTVTDGSGSLNVIVDSGSITASDPTFTDATGSTVPANAAFVAGTDGTNTRALKTDASGELQVDVLTVPTVTVTDGAGAMNVIIDSSATLSVDTTSADQITPIGTAADGAAVSGNPIRIAGKDGSGNTQDVVTDTSGELQIDVLTLPNVAQATAANLNVRADTSGATAAAPPARADYVGGLGSGATGGFLTGIPVCDSFVPINISTATTTLIVTGVSGRHVYICSMSLVTAAANNVAFIAGTGATCGTSTAGMSGGTTSSSGWNFAANGGLTQGSGIGAINRTETTGDSVCIVSSANTQLSGSLSYVIF